MLILRQFAVAPDRASTGLSITADPHTADSALRLSWLSVRPLSQPAVWVVQAMSGLTGKPVRDAGMGVYIGISYAEYAQAAAKAVPAVSTYTATGGALSVAAGVLMALYPVAGMSTAQ